MPLPSFTITGNLLDLLGNVALGEIVGNGLGGATPATIVFTSNVPAGYFVTFGGVAYRVDEVTATVGSDGTITRNGDPVQLLANDAGLSVDGLQWQVHASGMKRFWVTAPVDNGTVNLGTVVPVPSLGVGGVAFSQGELITLLANSASPLRVALDALYTASGATDEYHEYANLAAFPGTGIADRIYVAQDTGKFYHWTGSAYAQIAGNAATALKLFTARSINGVAFDGTADITVADATKLAISAVVDNTDGTISVGAVTGMEPLTPAAAIQTTSATPAIGKITLYNAASGNLAPAMPALSGIAVGRRLTVGRDPADTSPNTVTFSLPGGDTFYSSGATSFTLPISGERREFQVVSVSSVKYWVPAGSLNPLPGLDTRYRGTVATGVKGGRTTLLRRRDITNLDLLSPWYGAITAAVTNTGATTMTSPTINAMSASPSWCTPLGGTLVALPAFTSAFMFNWRTPNGGAVTPTVFPWPTTTTIEFELDTTTLGAFEVSFRPTVASASFFYNLWIDGRRVWDLPQTATVGQNSANNFLKFTGLPTGVHRYRVSLGSSAIWQVFTPQNTLPVPVPAKGPRLFFLGDSLESIGGAAGSSGVHTGIEMGPWPWRFAEMIGCNDVWLGGMGATGFIANAGGRTVTDGAIVSGSTNFDSATATFVTGDTSSPNNKVQIIGAGPSGGVLSALVVSRTSGTRLVIDTPASTSVTNAWASIGGSGANYPIRAYTDVIPAAPDVVFIDSYHNDTSFSASAIANSLTLTLNAIQSALPNTMIIVTGGFDSSGVGGASYTTIDNALLAVCTAHGVPYVAPANTGTVYDGAGNAVAVQGAWIDTNTTNLYIESDGTHETDAGMKYLAHRKTQSVLALLPA